MGFDLTKADLRHVAYLLESKSAAWARDTHLRGRRTVKVKGNYWDIPEADQKYKIRERDILEILGSRTDVVLDIPQPEKREEGHYDILTISRAQSQAGYGTSNIRVQLIPVDACDDSASSIIRPDFPYFALARRELEDAGVWQSMKANPGWKKLSRRRDGGTTYALDILGGEGFDLEARTDAVMNVQFPSEGALHQLELTTFPKTTTLQLYPEQVLADAYLGIYGTNGLDRDYPGCFAFRRGEVVAGGLGGVNGVSTRKGFEKAVRTYFEMSPAAFRSFFGLKGLPDAYKKALKSVL